MDRVLLIRHAPSTAPLPEVTRRALVDPDHVEPGGESGRQVVAGSRAAMLEALDGSATLPVLVSHGPFERRGS